MERLDDGSLDALMQRIIQETLTDNEKERLRQIKQEDK